MERYSRHNLIDWFSQEVISRKSICVVGAGAVGNEVIKALVLLGVGKIKVFDFDMIEEHNLTKSVLFRPSDIGKSKAEVAAQRASKLDPNVEVSYRHGDVLSLLPISEIQGFDCLVSCVDNFEARLRLNEMCLIAKIDFINLGIDSRYASIEAFPFSSQQCVACYECNLPHSVYGRIAERYSCGHLKKVSYAEKKIPTTIVTSGLAGSLGASIALRLGTSADCSSRRILLDSIHGYSTVTGDLGHSDDCPCCANFVGEYTIIPVAKAFASAPILSSLVGSVDSAEAVLRLCEPVVTSAKCSVCGEMPYEGQLVGRSKSETDETARYCPTCASASVDVSFQDEFSIRSFQLLFAGKIVPVSYGTATVGEQNFCFSFEEAL